MSTVSGTGTRIPGRPAMAGRLALALAVMAAAVVAGVGIGASPSSQPMNVVSTAPTLDFGFLPDPQFGSGYQTQGGYPQVYGAGGLSAVNAALAQVFSSVEEQTRQSLAGLAQEEDSSQADGPGLYATNPQQGVLYADHTVVSVLVPFDALPPGGTSGESWISATVLVPSGRAVQISDLFTHESAAMAALRTLLAKGLVDSSTCLVQSLGQIDANESSLLSELQPTPATFVHFAVTPYGLTVGFPQGMVTDDACGNTSATVTWSQLQTMLSPLGLSLEKGV
jgi:hypothetical protein